MHTLGGILHQETMQAAAVATGNGKAFPCYHPDHGGLEALVMQVTGITTATITFEGSQDGTTWAAVQVTPLGTGVAATTATADGLYRLSCKGLVWARARISAWTAGAITVEGIGVA